MDQYGPPPLNDSEIEEKISEVCSGKFIKVLEYEKKSTSETEERLLKNGFPVQLQGDELERIRESLKAGIIPPCDLLNNILLRCGIIKDLVEIETVASVTYKKMIKEIVSIHDSNGMLLDERAKEIEENDEMRSRRKEIWKMKETKKENIS